MKITELTLKITADENDIANGRSDRYLIRHENKMWTCSDEGLYPSEIKLADALQKVIYDYNGKEGNK